MMIATITHDQHGPAIRLGPSNLERLGLPAGQRVRIDIFPLPFTPRLESDGS